MAKPRKSRSSNANADAANYAVGYGKPPTARQFRTGQSGNPKGSSKKARARKVSNDNCSLDDAILAEAARKIPIVENGKPTQITTHKAVLRKLAIGAARGESAPQKRYLDQVQSALERQYKAKMERFGLLAQFKTEQAIGRTRGLISSTESIWPHADDVWLDYANCIGEVVGPIDAPQAAPFIALVADYRVWHARCAELQSIASRVERVLPDVYKYAVNAVARLLNAVRKLLPPSFNAQLNWDDMEIPDGALDVENLSGETISLTLLAPNSDDMAWCLYKLAGDAQAMIETIADRAWLDITANTTSFINRLQIERQSRDAGVAPPPAVPEFEQFYDSLTDQDDTPVDALTP